MRTQVTLKTLAERLNLSTSTVSRALTDQWDVNAHTKQIVIELALELNYKPNIMAVKLKQCQQKKTKITTKSKVTIKGMAQQLHLAPSTVSRALANKKDISYETRKLVLALAKKLHYYPNPVAQVLRTQYHKAIQQDFVYENRKRSR